MSAPGDISYARTSDGIDIAYMTAGSGPDLLVAPGFVTHLDMMWDFPSYGEMAKLAQYFRLIVFDKRGTGLSDRSLGFGSLEDRAQDIVAVLDAVGSESAILYGISEGGPLSIYVAASQPDRVRALILFGTAAAFFQQGGMPVTPGGAGRFQSTQEFIDWMAENWGRGQVYEMFMSHPPDTEAARRFAARYERSASTPQMAREIMTRNVEMNVTSFLPSISVPTLVMHCSDDPLISVEHGRALARGIPGAEYAEIDGAFHGSWRYEDFSLLSPPLGKFLRTLIGTSREPTVSEIERELATVLFTDIVDSTAQAEEMRDGRWRELLDRFEEMAARTAREAGGRIVKNTGDGTLATFSGPSQAIAAARAQQEAALTMGIGLRAGVHTGEIEVRGDDIGGIGVHIASRIAGLAGSGEILTSRTVRDLAVGSRVDFADRGSHTLKGVAEPWQVFAAS